MQWQHFDDWHFKELQRWSFEDALCSDDVSVIKSNFMSFKIDYHIPHPTINFALLVIWSKKLHKSSTRHSANGK